MSTIKAIHSFKNKVGLSIALLCMLIIGASTIMAMKAPEFKNAKAPMGKKPVIAKKHKKTSSYYWYTVNSSGVIVAGSQAYSGAKVDATYAEDNLPCTPGNDAECVRAFNSPISSFPSTATGVQSLYKQN